MSILQTIKRRGIISVLETGFHRIVPAWLLRFSVMNVYTLDRKKLVTYVEEPTNATPGLVLARVVEKVARENLARSTYNAIPASIIEKHFGYSASVSQKTATQLAGGVWAGVGRFPEIDLGFEFDLSKTQSWIYCAYVNKEMRGKKIYGNVLAFAVNHLHDHGFKEVLVAVNPWNKPSIRAHEKFTGDPFGRIYSIRFLSLAIVFCSGGLKRNRMITFRSGSNPVVIEKN